MVARVIKVDENGWWVLRLIGPKINGEVTARNATARLPTFMLPKDTRYGDRIILRCDGHPDYSAWRVVQHIRCVRTHYGRPKVRRASG